MNEVDGVLGDADTCVGAVRKVKVRVDACRMKQYRESGSNAVSDAVCRIGECLERTPTGEVNE
jgi:hypothetical protein